MKAVVYDAFGEPPSLRDVPDPVVSSDGAVIAVGASGLCRSDWHAWMGHDPDVRLPHVPGHELAGTLVALGKDVRSWHVGERVTVPFVCACGACEQCSAGHQQVCDHQFQPGFTAWGSFAELVAVDHAAANLIRLPDTLSFEAAASLGCRFATAYRAVVHRGGIAPGRWVSVHGCGGVGLAAVAIAAAAGARVAAVDIAPAALQLAGRLGAEVLVDATSTADVPAFVRDATGGGVHLSLDALGSAETCAASILSLRKRGRHVQVGLLPAVLGHPAVPMESVIARELEVVGSHGMPAHEYNEMLAAVATGRLRPDLLVTRRIHLHEAADALIAMAGPDHPAGVTTIVP